MNIAATFALLSAKVMLSLAVAFMLAAWWFELEIDEPKELMVGAVVIGLLLSAILFVLGVRP